jgi:cardiolipin synthase
MDPLTVVALEDLLTMDIPECEMILDPWIREKNIVEVHSFRGIAKTWLMLSAAVAIATGSSFLSWRAPKARRTLYLTDAYFVGTAAYVQALAAAARDGVDVRLMVPGASDIPALSPLSRAGYRPLLQAGVRVFEWNGTMLHAKTAVADGRWARVGSTNLNLASFVGNYELDVAVEGRFAGTMANSSKSISSPTEIVLTRRNRVRPVPGEERAPSARRAMSGSAGRAAAGAVSVGSALGAALTGRRVLDAAESGLLAKMGGAILALSIVAAIWPHFVAWPAAVLGIWLGVAWLVKAFALRRAALPSHRPAGNGQGGATRDGDPQARADIIRPSRP